MIAPHAAKLRIRRVLAPGMMIGPGKADLLEGIRDTGSSAAGRRMGMSYKRAWMLVVTLDGSFPDPLVERSCGGRSHGGARLTATGDRVLAHFHVLGSRATHAAAAETDAIAALRGRQTPAP